MTLEFEGRDRMLERIDRAIYGDCAYETTTCLRRALVECIADPGIRLPDCCFHPVTDHYARREVFTHPGKGYSIIAMTWGPGQGTPIHDHAGMWCVEGVWSGSIEVVSYQLVEEQNNLCRFENVGSIVAGSGSAGSLIPPHEYHTIANTHPTKVAVSVHIYRNTMEMCNTFLPEPEGESEGWYRRAPKQLGLDAA